MSPPCRPAGRAKSPATGDGPFRIVTYEINVAPHNYYSHLATLISAHLCAVLPNARIMEIDIDDVPWKDDLISASLDIREGQLTIPSAAGWGAEVNEAVLREHPWRP
jgi:galactonate dehydratase